MGADAEYHDTDDPLGWRDVWRGQRPLTVISQRQPQPAFLDAYRNEVDRVTRQLTTNLNSQLFNIPTTTLDQDAAIAATEGADMPSTGQTLSQLLAQQARLEERIALAQSILDQYGVNDPYEVGSILQWDKTFRTGTRRTYSYAALKTPIGWFVTGRSTSVGLRWDQLVDLLVEDALHPPVLYSATELVEHTPET